MIRLYSLMAAASLLITACGSEQSTSCRELREPSDPASFLHVVDADGARFLTDPPTSGPHVSGLVPSGVLDSPIEPAIQVSILEGGVALAQYDPLLPADQVDQLTELAGPNLVVAPGIGLPNQIVVTAWTWKLECTSLDIDAVGRFADRRVAAAPGSD